MKICPNCDTRYTDETLQYCLQDGTRLQNADLSLVGPENDPETIVRSRQEDISARSAVRRPRTGLIVLLTAFVTAVLLVLGGVGAWLLFRANSNAGMTNNSRIDNATPTPDHSPSPTTSPTANANSGNTNVAANGTTPDPAAAARARREITNFLGRWKSATESKDVDSYVDQYADKVAYYNNPSASRAEVQNDKRRAFARYDHIDIQISNINTAVDPDGETAVTTFDKEWEFVGEKESHGKVRSELRLRKIDGNWKIVGEHDQKVYYVD